MACPGTPGDQEEYFFHDVPLEVVAAAFEHPFEQSGRPFEDPGRSTPGPMSPPRCSAGATTGSSPPDFQRRLAAERLGCAVEEIPGGHLAALSRPVELADYLTSR